MLDADSSTPDEEILHHNKLVFLAQLTNCLENNVPDPQAEAGPYDFSSYALFDLCDAFEVLDTHDTAKLISLRAASLWMIYCADRLWTNTQNQRSVLHKSQGWNPRKEWAGFHPDRWRLWVEGFERSRGIGDVDTEELVERALTAVEKVEDQSWRIAEEERFG